MTDEPTPAEKAAGLRLLADMIDANPDIRVAYLNDVHVWFARDIDELRAIARAGKAAGAKVEKNYVDDYATVTVTFGPLKAKALVSRREVCERVVVGTEVVKVPDPAYVPPDTPLIEKVREITEWRCRPLLAEDEAATA